ncbi:LacI family transcriptional regulator [Aestuariibacter sp. AA17]|uniref:LacI family transcriptional regulator n=1 Tax=Fluctibacter corallii TaxID=2984329 RepID=A0ABT3A8A2_9ALTE|nr:LacI family DNA-binding transcriptional regulator [Aestuariibacter sp. AA17]MCV2884512.1 LacI family transcriptional regulator [Aestuariibacter sp. AA17]
MATIYEVSKLAGVSLATVSRVLNNSASVSEKTRTKVNQAMKQLDYKPNAIAKSLASSRSDCIGILVGEFHGPFYGTMMGGIEKEFRAANKHIVVTASHCDLEKEKEDIEFLISRNCDALILHVEAVSDEYLINLAQGKTPIYVINRYIPQIADRCICLNNELGGYIATKTVLEHGHRDILYIAGPKVKADARERLAGHYRALREFGIAPDVEREYFGDYMQTGGYAGMQHFFDKDLPVSAVVCGNDEMANGAMSAIREHQLDIPNDISVVGFDDVLFSSYTHPKLTTIEYPIAQMGKMAAQLVLQDVYKQGECTTPHMFEPKLVSRDSLSSV